jgi:hypothetical protein
MLAYKNYLGSHSSKMALNSIVAFDKVVIYFEQEWCKSTLVFSLRQQGSNLLTSQPVMSHE